MKKKFDLLNNTRNDLEKIDKAVEEEKEMLEEEKDELRTRVMQKLNKESEKEKVKKNKNRKVAVAAVLSCTVLGGIALTNENVMASVEALGEKIEVAFGGNKKVGGFKSEINKTMTDKGITLSIKEAINDNGVIKVTGNIDYSQYNFGRLGVDKISDIQGIPEEEFDEIEIYSDKGEKVELQSIGTAMDYHEGKDSGKVNFSTEIKVVENLETGYKIHLPYNKVRVGYSDDKFREKSKVVRGDWGVTFEVDNSEMMKNTEIIKLDKKFTGEYLGEKFEYEVKSLVITPVSYTLNYAMNRDSFQFNMVELSENSYNVDMFEFEVYDQNGEKVYFKEVGGTMDRFETKYVREDGREITKLKIVPVMKNHMEEKVIKRFEENSFEIDLNK